VEGPVGSSLTIDLAPYDVVVLVEKNNGCPDGSACPPGVETWECNWCLSDFDNDTIADTFDNCLLVANFNQVDSDNDSTGDACDPCNNNSSCCDYTDTVARHVEAERAGLAYWWRWASGSKELICETACDDDEITLFVEKENPGNYYVGSCPQETCDDAKDNNGDYLIDCLDPDCADDEVCGDEEVVRDAPPGIGVGPFLAFGSWPVLPTTPENALSLDQNYNVLWTFSDDYGSCSGLCTHSAEYQVWRQYVGDIRYY
jgi:hypothetical protein